MREETDEICVKKHNGEKAFFNSKGLYNILGECLLFPSKEMRDWRKFAWKKGDVLISNDYGIEAINEFLKDLWHPAEEEPDKSKSDIITLGFDNDAYLQFKESILWNKESWRHSISRCQIIKWAYLSDILPKEGGEK